MTVYSIDSSLNEILELRRNLVFSEDEQYMSHLIKKYNKFWMIYYPNDSNIFRDILR